MILHSHDSRRYDNGTFWAFAWDAYAYYVIGFGGFYSLT